MSHKASGLFYVHDARPTGKTYRLFDGGGLYLEIAPAATSAGVSTICGRGSPVCAIVLIATNGLAGASLAEKGNERYQQELRDFMKWQIR
ncbi:hypothetical protein [Burkholderia ubonensis]|uniref:hypothetical protein n=1 Tax=Burkholderia ubonensis TaxID=101571 RepID=UPI0007523600|nr:hypothetical protein [Burkholderia ubonensis]